ncbi:MAG TPA: hypothetical protein VHO25_08045 [Polyangiaceae bacterium]|nr:hypothetical protein [Polyangiaceae bacterium]
MQAPWLVVIGVFVATSCSSGDPNTSSDSSMPQTSATTKTRSCEYDAMAASFVPVHWCVQYQVPLDTDGPCEGRVGNWYIQGALNDGCPNENVIGTCFQTAPSSGPITVYESTFTPGELDEVCAPGTYVPAPGHSPPEPTGCTITVTPPEFDNRPSTTKECQAFFILPDYLLIRSTDTQVIFGIWGWTTVPTGSYSSDGLSMDLSVNATGQYIGSEWQVKTNWSDDMDLGQFSLTVASFTELPDPNRLKFHGTLDATFALPGTTTLNDHPFIISVQTD